jgi:hypothetical protein
MSQARKNRRRNWRSGSRADELSLHGVPTSIWRVPWRFVGFLGGFTLHALGQRQKLGYQVEQSGPVSRSGRVRESFSKAALILFGGQRHRIPAVYTHQRHFMRRDPSGDPAGAAP